MADVPETLAVNGGAPVRAKMLQYGRQTIEGADIEAVTAALTSDWLTTGPRIDSFEKAFAAYVGATHAVAVSSGTAALHAAVFALGIGPGDEVIVPSITFASTANCVLFQGGTVVFADVEPDTLLIDPADVSRKITPATKAIIAVDYAGQPADYARLRALADERGIALVADACHALGASDGGRRAGTLADLSAFSLHPVKPITTGEGGVITTERADLARAMRRFRSHGITSDHRQREDVGSWFYEMTELGYNYRLSDFAAALGESQLSRLDGWLGRRRDIAALYDAALAKVPGVTPLIKRDGVEHGYHLYVVRIDPVAFGMDRDTAFKAMRAENIGVNVHYIPVHMHPYYRERFGTGLGLCPAAEKAYEQILSLPIFPLMTDGDAVDVVRALVKVQGTHEAELYRQPFLQKVCVAINT